MKCATCDGTGHLDGTPELPRCPDCKCEGCTIVTGELLILCPIGGEKICMACMNAETTDGCPVAKGETL